MSNTMRIVGAVCGCLLIWSGAAWARPTGGAAMPDYWDAAARAAIKTPDPFIIEARPSIFLLPDKEGKLQPVLDFPYEEFEELYKLKHRLARRSDPPRYVFEKLSAEGKVEEGRAELTFRFQILVRVDDWVRLPLRLDQGLLHGDVKYAGPGRQFVDCEAEGRGFVCWIRGKPDSRHELILTVLVPLEESGEETRLILSVPRAAASELKIRVPGDGAIGTVSEGAVLLASGPADGGATEFRAARLDGEFQLAWSKPPAPGEDAPAVLEAVGTLLARLDGRGIAGEAALSVRSLGAAFDKFTVRLPPEAEFLPPAVNPAGYALVPIAPSGEGEAVRRSVEVRLAKKTVGPVEVRIGCRRDVDPVEGGAWIELAGFDVVGAARQWGTVAVSSDGRRQAVWGTNDRVRQLDSLPDALRKENPLAGFEYYGQPYSLTVRLAPRKTRIAVAPEYVMLVERNRVELNGKLSYAIRGPEVTALTVAVPGWELDEIGPERLVVGDGVTVEGERVSIPLARPTSGPVELHIRAHRILGGAAAPLTAALPRPEADSVAPAVLAVAAADNVELIPDDRLVEGLSRQPGAPPMAVPPGQQGPMYYRGSGGPCVFAAEMRVHPGRIAVRAAAQVALGDGAADVRQKFAYEIMHEPAGSLLLDLPRELAAPGRIQLLLDGKPLSLILTDGAGESPITARAVLPEARIGRCELSLHYAVAAAPSPGRPAAVSIPLAAPGEGELVSNEITVKAGRNVRPRIRGINWTAARSSGENDVREGLRATAAQRRGAIDLELHWEKNEADAVTVDTALVQVWFTSAARHDRAVFQFATDRKEVEFELPAGSAAERTAALVDGVEVAPRRTGETGLVVPLGGGGEGRRARVELRYHFSVPRPPRGAIGLELPRLKLDSWTRRTYLQIFLPADEHLLAAPAGWTGEYAWAWSGGLWARRQTTGQTELESWAGASPLAPPAEGMNRYLFSSLGNPPRVEALTAGRTWLVLWASAAALVAGLLLIHVPVCRRPAALFAAGVALPAVGLIAPEPALLLAQAAALGLLLALAAAFIERGIFGRRRGTPRPDSSVFRPATGSSGAVPSTPPSAVSAGPPPADVTQSTGIYQQ